MSTYRRAAAATSAAALIVVLAACGGNQVTAPTPVPAASTTEPTAAPAPTPTPAPPPVGPSVTVQGTVATGGMVSGACPNLKFVMLEKGTNLAWTVDTTASTQFINGACVNISGALQVQVKGILTSPGKAVATSVQSQDHTGG